MRAVLSVRLTLIAILLLTTPTLALNAYRRVHHLPPLHNSAALAATAKGHADGLARRKHLDHDGFHERMSPLSSIAAFAVADLVR